MGKQPGKQQPKQQKKNTGIWWVVGVVVLGAVAFVGLSQLGGGRAKTGTVKTDAELHAVRNVVGSSTAKVEILDWSDYL